MDDLVSVQVFCSDVKHYDAFNAVYRTYFKREFPARAFIGSARCSSTRGSKCRASRSGARRNDSAHRPRWHTLRRAALRARNGGLRAAPRVALRHGGFWRRLLTVVDARPRAVSRSSDRPAIGRVRNWRPHTPLQPQPRAGSPRGLRLLTTRACLREPPHATSHKPAIDIRGPMRVRARVVATRTWTGRRATGGHRLPDLRHADRPGTRHHVISARFACLRVVRRLDRRAARVVIRVRVLSRAAFCVRPAPSSQVHRVQMAASERAAVTFCVPCDAPG